MFGALWYVKRAVYLVVSPVLMWLAWSLKLVYCAVWALCGPIVWFTSMFVVTPVRIAVWNWLQLVTLPLNIFLRVTLGTTWFELLRNMDTWLNKFVIVTLLQYIVSVLILGATIGVVYGLMLAMTHHFFKIPSVYIEIPLKFWRIPSVIIRTIRYYLNIAIQKIKVGMRATHQDSFPTPPPTPKFSPYDKAIFLRDFYPGDTGSRPASMTFRNSSTLASPKAEKRFKSASEIGLPDRVVHKSDTSQDTVAHESTSQSIRDSTDNVWDEFDSIPSLLDDTDRLTTVTNRKQKQKEDVIQIHRM